MYRTGGGQETRKLLNEATHLVSAGGVPIMFKLFVFVKKSFKMALNSSQLHFCTRVGNKSSFQSSLQSSVIYKCV